MPRSLTPTHALLALAAALGVAGRAGADSCPDMAQFRSERVRAPGAFDPAKLSGLWYEAAYIDVAQVGSKCQTLNGTYSPETKRLSMDFSVKYGPLPFTIVEIYDPVNASQPGLYLKHVNEPGGKLLNLKTAMVDVTESADGKLYETVTMYSCVNILGANVVEVVYAMREPLDADNMETLSGMEATAKSLGVTYDPSKLKLVNRTAMKC